MADISVYKLVLADQPSISLSSNYPPEKKTDIDNIINWFHKHNIYINGNKIILPNGKELTNRDEIIDYYLNPDKKKPKNITEIDNILGRSKIHDKDNIESISHKIKSSDKFEWINI